MKIQLGHNNTKEFINKFNAEIISYCHLINNFREDTYMSIPIKPILPYIIFALKQVGIVQDVIVIICNMLQLPEN